MRRGAEIEFQAAAMQARRGIVRRDERDLVALADLADGDGDRALIGADDGADFFLGDQALGFGAALLRIGLVVGEHEADLGAAEAGEALALRQRQIEIVVLVDDVGRGLERLLRIDADLRAGAGQRIDHADHHFGSLRAGRDRQQRGGGGGSKQHFSAGDGHGEILCLSAAIDETVDADGKASMNGKELHQSTASCLFLRSVTSINPGACVIANGSFAAAITDCGVTPQAQNTGISSASTGTASP